MHAQPSDALPKIMFARYYGANLGRFLSVDPVSINRARALSPQRLNRYSYVANNPVSYKDPSGLDLVMAATDKGYDRMVTGLARLYESPAGRAMIQRADSASSTVKMKVEDLGGKKRGKGGKGKPGRGEQTRTDGLTTIVSSTMSDGTKVLSKDAEGASAYVSLNTRGDKAEDPQNLAHEIGGHLNDALTDADPELGGDYKLDSFDPEDHSSGEAAEEEVEGEVPAKPSEGAVNAVKDILKPKG